MFGSRPPKRRVRGFSGIDTIKTVIFLIAGCLDFQAINSHAGHTI
jgi:transposase